LRSGPSWPSSSAALRPICSASTNWLIAVGRSSSARASRSDLPSFYTASTSVLAPTRKDVLVRMPSELKRLLADEVRRTGQSLNDVAVGILASRFAVPFEPSGRPGKEPGKSGSVLLRMPVELKETLAARAAQRKRKLNDL